MRVLIIVTDPQYSLLSNREEWVEEPDREAWSIRVKEDQIIVVSQSQCDINNEEERLKQIRETTTQRVINIGRAFEEGQHIGFLAYHSRYMIPQLLRSQVDGLKFQAMAPFNHESNDSQEFVYPVLCDLVANPSAVMLDRAVDAIVAKQGKTRADRAATIRHRFIRLFLPAVVDLQIWREMDRTRQSLADIAHSYRKFSERIDEARTLIYDRRSSTDSLERIVKESGLTENQTWCQTKCLLPLADPSDAERDAARLFCEVFLKGELEANEVSTIFTDPARLESFMLWCTSIDERLLKLRNEIIGPEK